MSEKFKNDLRNFVFDLQRFGDGETDGEPGGDSGSQGKQGAQDNFGFSGKFVEKVNPVTKKTMRIPVEMEAVIGNFISATRGAVEGQYKPLLEKLENEASELKDIQIEYEKLKELSMTAEERAQENAKKKILEHEKTAKKASEDATMWKQRFEQSTIRNDILSSFGDEKLFNPAQVAMLFQNEGEARISEVVDDEGKPTGKFETKMTLALEDEKGEPEIVEGTPNELFKKWIKLDRNLHHVQNDITPGGGTKPTGNSRGGGKIDTSLHPTERMKQYRNAQAGG